MELLIVLALTAAFYWFSIAGPLCMIVAAFVALMGLIDAQREIDSRFGDAEKLRVAQWQIRLAILWPVLVCDAIHNVLTYDMDKK